VCSRSREFRVLAARFIPLKGFPPPAAVSCRHDRCPLDVRFPRSLDRFVASVAGFDVRVSTPRMQHLRGVAPQMSPYRRPPFPARIRPILSGLWPPSRSFDRGIAPVADASRTLCASIPARRNPCSFAAALVVRLWLEARGERASLRSAPASSSLTVQPCGWGSLRRPWWRGVRRDALRRRDRDEAGFTFTFLSS